jgi:acyl-[acyl-carrier-protein] desaturase
MNVDAFLVELEPVAATLLDRHLATTKEWFPHELVPYHRARDFQPGEQWSEDHTDIGGPELSPQVRSALFLNLLTEDNLPYYFRDIERMFGTENAFGAWSRRWTAEEGRHSIVIRDYMTVSRAVDPTVLERARMQQVSGGETPQPESPVVGMVYVTLQELATRITHRNTGKLIGDPIGYEIMARVGADENMHFLFYRDLTTAAIKAHPSRLVIAMDEVIRNFAMPGTGVADYAKHAARIADAGIYDLNQFVEQILQPVVIRHWGLEKIEGLNGEAEEARTRLLTYIERIGRVGRRMAEKRANAAVTSAVG